MELLTQQIIFRCLNERIYEEMRVSEPFFKKILTQNYAWIISNVFIHWQTDTYTHTFKIHTLKLTEYRLKYKIIYFVAQFLYDIRINLLINLFYFKI